MEKVPPSKRKPVSPGSLKNVKILVVGNAEYYESLERYLGNQMGFSHKNLFYFLDCEKMGNSPQEINPELVILIKNRQDELDEVTWPTSGVRFFDIIQDENSKEARQVANYAFQDYCVRIFAWLWNFWHDHHSFLRTKPVLEVEFLPGPKRDDKSPAVKLDYYPAPGERRIKKIMIIFRRIFRMFGAIPGWLQPASIKLMPHLKSLIHFFKNEAYGLYFTENEALPFKNFENGKFYFQNVA